MSGEATSCPVRQLPRRRSHSACPTRAVGCRRSGQPRYRRAARPGADLFADVQHRRLILCAFADTTMPSISQRVEHAPHRVHGRLVGRVLVAPAHPPGGHDRGGLGHPGKLKREISIDRAGCSWRVSSPEIVRRRSDLRDCAVFARGVGKRSRSANHIASR